MYFIDTCSSLKPKGPVLRVTALMRRHIPLLSLLSFCRQDCSAGEMVVSLLLLGLGLVLTTPSGDMMKGITANLSQEELQPAAKQMTHQSTNSALSDKNISLSVPKNVMSAAPPTSRRSYFVILKGHTLSKDQNCLNGLRVWRKALDMNESCLLGNSFTHGSTDMVHQLEMWTNSQPKLL